MGAGERLTTTAAAAEQAFTGTCGRRIVWRSWVPDARQAHAVLALSHGFGEHSGRYGYVGERLAREGHAVYALDHHGHGKSQGARARISFDDAVADLDRLIDLAMERHPHKPVFLLGHSMGGAIALRYALAHEERLAGLILSGPLVEVQGRELAKLLGHLLGAIAPGLPLARIDPNLVSRDRAVVDAYVTDPLIHHQPVPAGTIAEFLRHAATLPDAVGQLRLPTLLLYGTADRLCAPEGAIRVAERIGSQDLTVSAYDGLYHEILNEPERDRVLAEISSWLAARLPAATS